MKAVLQDIPVMYVTSEFGPRGAADAFTKLEGILHWQLKGRKFYGTMHDGEYRACVAVAEGDDPKKLGLRTAVIPGGEYFKEKIADWEQHVSEIAPTCNEIIKKFDFDDTRPIIEFYRSKAELFLFIPIHFHR